jgi:hypothetical protein
VQVEGLQPGDGTCQSSSLFCITMLAGAWGFAECCVAVGALATITSLLRRARPALSRLLADSSQAIDKFYTRTVDAAGRGKALCTHASDAGSPRYHGYSPSWSSALPQHVHNFSSFLAEDVQDAVLRAGARAALRISELPDAIAASDYNVTEV